MRWETSHDLWCGEVLQGRMWALPAPFTVVADCCLAGVSTRRVDELVRPLGINSFSKSQVSRMVESLDEHVEQFRHGPLDVAGPFTVVSADMLTMLVREGGRVSYAVVLLATGVNGDGHREVLGVRVATSETGLAWNGVFADLVARGLAGVRLVTSDAHAGLVEAIAAHLSGAAWQRCRTHDAANLMAMMLKSMWPAVKALLHSAYDQPDVAAVNAQFERLNKEIRRRMDSVGNFPTWEAIVRLVGAVLAEQTDEWLEGRRYLGLDVLAHCRPTLVPGTGSEEVATSSPTALTA